jgi:outer membrane protein assembly factor BamB
MGIAQTISSNSNAIAVGQAVVGSSTFLIGNSVLPGRIFVAGADGGLVSGNVGADLDTGTPAIVSSTLAYVGRGNQLVRFNPSDISAAATTVGLFSSDVVRTSPILGRSPPDGGTAIGYAVSRAGVLIAFDETTGAELWRRQVSVASVLTHPTLDCNRGASSKTGVLYVGSSNGMIQAIIVDSPGLLDTAGAWPKYQRSAGNAGNDDTASFPTNWPGCP